MEMGSIYLVCVVRDAHIQSIPFQFISPCGFERMMGSHFNTKLESPFNFTNIHLLPVYRVCNWRVQGEMILTYSELLINGVLSGENMTTSENMGREY